MAVGRPVGCAAVKDSRDGPRCDADGARRGDEDMAAGKPGVSRSVDVLALVVKDSGG